MLINLEYEMTDEEGVDCTAGGDVDALENVS